MISVTLIIATLVVLLAGLYAKARLRHADFVRELRDDYFSAAEALIENEDTPDSIVMYVEHIGTMMNERWLLWRIAGAFLRGRVRDFYRSPPPEYAEFKRDVRSLPEPMLDQFSKALVSGVMSTLYRSVFMGSLLRRLSLYRLSKKNKRHFDGDDDAEAVVSGLTFGRHEHVA